jgi:hypothetical protein
MIDTIKAKDMSYVGAISAAISHEIFPLIYNDGIPLDTNYSGVCGAYRYIGDLAVEIKGDMDKIEDWDEILADRPYEDQYDIALELAHKKFEKAYIKKKYTVEVTRTVVEVYQVEVEADSKDDAEAMVGINILEDSLYLQNYSQVNNIPCNKKVTYEYNTYKNS